MSKYSLKRVFMLFTLTVLQKLYQIFSLPELGVNSDWNIWVYNCKIKILIQEKTTIFNFSVLSDHK